LHHSEYFPIAKKVAREKSERWHDIDDIEGEILYELSRKKPEKPLHAWRIAWNTKVDCIRRERGVTGKKKNIRNTYSLKEAEGLSYNIDTDFDNKNLIQTMIENSNDIEKQIISMLYEGYSKTEISKVLGISNSALNKKIEKIQKKTSIAISRR
jgi:DNA-directed RNA polymerase specialized sigma24 family protein